MARVFIVPLPPAFNTELVETPCRLFFGSGIGPLPSEYDQDVYFHRELQRSPWIVATESNADLFYVPFYFARRSRCSNLSQAALLLSFRQTIEPWMRRNPPFADGRPRFFMAAGGVCSCSAEEYPQGALQLTSCNPLDESPDLGAQLRILGWEQQPVNDRAGTWRWMPRNVVMPYTVFLKPPHSHSAPWSLSDRTSRHILVLNSAAADSRHRKCIHCSVCNGLIAGGCPSGCLGIRSQLAAAMRRYNASNTGHVATFSTQQEDKRRAVFCLEPSGDTLTRKSFYEDLLLGCIPVVFRDDGDYLAQLAFSRVVPYPKMWVVVPLSRVLNAEFDIVAHLSAIPAALVRSKQRAIRKWAVSTLSFATQQPFAPREAFVPSVFESHGAMRHVLNAVRWANASR